MSSFIRFYKSGELVHQIDSSSSLEVNINGGNLKLIQNYLFAKDSMYYVNFDEGVIESVKGYHLKSAPICNDTFLDFQNNKLNLVPSKRKSLPK